MGAPKHWLLLPSLCCFLYFAVVTVWEGMRERERSEGEEEEIEKDRITLDPNFS